MVERIRMRKIVAVIAYFITYATWIPVALIPFIIDVPNTGAVTLLLFFIAVRGAAIAFVTTSWNGWLKDIVPFRTSWATSSPKRLESWRPSPRPLRLCSPHSTSTGGRASQAESDEIFGYSYAILFGCHHPGLRRGAVHGAECRNRKCPVARMGASQFNPSSTIGAPFRDKEFRGLINLHVHVELRRPVGRAVLYRLHAGSVGDAPLSRRRSWVS